MNNTLVFLRHGATQLTKDSTTDEVLPISRWVLSGEGKIQAEKAAENPELQDVDLIVISTEEKAWETAQPLIERLRKEGRKFEIVRSERIAELNRDEGGYMDKQTYEKAAKEMLMNRDVSVSNWETANHALERFTTGVGIVDAEYSNRKILFIGHGYTFGMYFAQQKGELDKNLYEWVHSRGFCDWGIVKDGKVIRDLGPNQEWERPGEKMV
jgi:broad specificity phosphatase PhoE